ncbi:MAG TPA: DUF4846 domain-containing protein, partial [Hyphomicrobiaceae bacterium]|nr:DUF4846 domain-containing protein [Hyphomicrobiaceae bacterium]
ESLVERIPPPAGAVRETLAPGSFGAWLRGLPLKPKGAPVLLFDGRAKPRQDVHIAVIDIDVGTRDLQQCADAIMRLRAEWLLASGRVGEIAFNFTGGGRVSFARWADGWRPRAERGGISWSQSAKADATYPSFRRYMDRIFSYAGTASLERELKPVAEPSVGDVIIKGGFPGHAVLIVDAAILPSGARRFLLLQSFMPAQEMHILTNPSAADGSPWYDLARGSAIVTPEWTFPAGALRRF